VNTGRPEERDLWAMRFATSQDGEEERCRAESDQLHHDVREAPSRAINHWGRANGRRLRATGHGCMATRNASPESMGCKSPQVPRPSRLQLVLTASECAVAINTCGGMGDWLLPGTMAGIDRDGLTADREKDPAQPRDGGSASKEEHVRFFFSLRVSRRYGHAPIAL
jgi:hypothetical protein